MNRYTWFAAMNRNEPGSMNRAPGCDPCNEPNWFERFIATKSNISHVLGSVNYSYAQSSFSQRCLPIKVHSGFVLGPNLEHQPEPLCYREARIQVQIYIVALPPSCLAAMMATKMVAAARGTGKPSTHGLSAQERGCRDAGQCLGIDLCIQKDFTLDES